MIESYAYIAIFSVLLFVAGCVESLRRRLQQIPRYFVTFMCLEALRFFCKFVINTPDAPLKSFFLALLIVSSFLLGPCIWCLAREIRDKKCPSEKRLPAYQNAVICLALLLVMPLAATSNFSPSYAPPNRELSTDYWLLVNVMDVLAVGLFFIQAIFYWSKSYAILKTLGINALRKQGLFVSWYEGCPTLVALQLTLACFVLTIIVSFLSVIHCMLLGPPTFLSLSLCIVESCCILAALFIFMANVNSVKTLESDNVVGPREPSLTSQSNDAELLTKYSRSPLKEHDRKKIEEKIVYAMLESKLYQKSNLTLQQLSKHLNEKPHYVSQVLNQNFNCSFFELVNQYRIRLAKELICQKPKLSMIEISENVGFNSKSTFNAVFKKLTHMTPSQYKQDNAGA